MGMVEGMSERRLWMKLYGDSHSNPGRFKPLGQATGPCKKVNGYRLCSSVHG